MEKGERDAPISKEYKICEVRREEGSQRWSVTVAVKGGHETSPTPAFCGSCLLQGDLVHMLWLAVCRELLKRLSDVVPQGREVFTGLDLIAI